VESHADIETWPVVAHGVDERAYAELVLVLEARGIPSRGTRRAGGWALSVPAADAERALRELRAYTAENARAARAQAAPPALGAGWVGVISFIAVLLGVAICAHQLAFGIDWLAVGRVDAERMLAGQWWRAVTALTLHADTAHLLANVAFGALFTFFVGRYLGGGVGWVAILGAGALGNAVNAWLQAPNHLSIGASTAVFGALGILTAHAWRRGLPSGTTRRGRIAPIVAGIALLAYTGTAGENTDIGAHLMGFIAGFGIGLTVARLKISAAPRVQWTAAILAWLLVAGAWAWGIATDVAQAAQR